MDQGVPSTPRASSRREFLKKSAGSILGAGAAASLPIARSAHAAGSDLVKIALVGCGGRGSGAAGNALSTRGPTKLWAMADAFPDRLQASLDSAPPLLPDGQGRYPIPSPGASKE